MSLKNNIELHINKYTKDIKTFQERLETAINGGYRNAAHDLLDEIIDAKLKIKENKRLLNEH